MPNEEFVQRIVTGIFSQPIPKIDESRRAALTDLVAKSINGDTPVDQIVIAATSGSEEKKIILAYILTNARVIKIEIDDKSAQASSPSLASIVNVERKTIEGNRTQVIVSFPNDFFGLRFASDAQQTSDFFQKIDQARVKS